MERVTLTETNTVADPERIFRLMPQPGLVARLGYALADTARELAAGPVSYLRVALFPDRVGDWFPIKLATLVGASLAHPLETIRAATAVDAIELKRRRRLLPVLSMSALLHGALIVYLFYLAFLSPFARMRIVNKAYRKFDPNVILAPLYYPPQIKRLAPAGPTMTLEEIRQRERKRREEIAKAQAEKEKAEKAKKEKEEAERKAAEEAAKLAAEKKEKPGIPEVNMAPIKDTIGKLWELYQAGGLDVPDKGFSVMAGFKVEPDGSLSHIRIIKQSPNRLIDEKALEILWNIGESHALSEVAVLSSATISLDVTDDIARLRITAFAPTPEIAKAKADQLSGLFWLLRLAQKNKNPEVYELLSMLKVSSRGKFVDTDLIVSRARASQMMRTGFEKPSTPPQ
jgi:hypothetical protein